MRELKIYHPNAKGTGSCLKVAQMADGNVMLTVCHQKQSCGMPGFSWENGVSFIADWRSLSEILMVFRGECESLGDGRGLSYAHDFGWSKLMLRHVTEPVLFWFCRYYVLEIYEKRGDVESRGIFRLSIAEALGLSLIFEGVLHHTLIGGEP